MSTTDSELKEEALSEIAPGQERLLETAKIPTKEKKAIRRERYSGIQSLESVARRPEKQRVTEPPSREYREDPCYSGDERHFLEEKDTESKWPSRLQAYGTSGSPIQKRRESTRGCAEKKGPRRSARTSPGNR